MNFHFHKFYNKNKHLFIGALGVLIIIVSFLFRDAIPPADSPDTLEVLYLDSSSNLQPTFRMQAQQTYNLETNTFGSQTSVGADLSPSSDFQASPRADLSPSSPSLSQIDLSPQSLSLQDLSLALSKSNLSPSLQDLSPLHIMVQVEAGSQIGTEFIDGLEILSKYFPSVSLSLIPDNMSDQTYISWGKQLHTQIQAHHLDNVAIIWYPSHMDTLDLYDSELFSNIGVVVRSCDDFSNLEALYNHFASDVSFYVRDDIAHYYEEDCVTAARVINALYYLLAVKYPNIDTIFSPYIKNKLFPEDEYYLDSASDTHSICWGLYQKLVSKPWLTESDTEEISNFSHYRPLHSYDEVSGKIELILSPNADILNSSFSYLSYKINSHSLGNQAAYPYLVHLDTTLYPNGVSRLKLSSYQDDHQLITESLDIKINNPIQETHSPRISVAYPIESKPSYASNYIPILMYHSILDTVTEEEQNSCVEVNVFEAQIKGLLDAGYTPINFKILKDYLEHKSGLPKKPILITMDDGYFNNYEKAYPIYQKYNVQATLFVSPYYMLEENTGRHFGWEAAREMEASGLIDIQSHGYNHTPFPYLSLKDLQYHISQSFGLLEKNLGPRDVFVVACPQFRNTPSTRKLLTSLGIDFQITKLAWVGTGLTPIDTCNLKRINVPNTMSPEELIQKINTLTYSSHT